LGFENLRDMYAANIDFAEAYEAAENPVLRERIPWIYYMIQEGLLFRGNQLCILNCSMRENLFKEKHISGLAGHFGHEKTFAKLNESYLWLGMRIDVKRFVDRCKVLPTFEGAKVEYRFLSAIAHTRKAMGGHKYGFCIGITEDTKRG
jgi:hypothetical protein